MKFGVREICDVVFKSIGTTTLGSKTFVNGQPVLYIDTAKTSTLEGAATTVYAEGGKGNTRLLAWEGEKTLTFTVEDALMSELGFSVLSGAGLIDNASETLVHRTTRLISGDGGAVSLTQEAIGEAVNVNADEGIFVSVLDEGGSVVATYKAGNTGPSVAVTTVAPLPLSGLTAITTSDVIVVVDYYTVEVAGYNTLEIEAGNFAGYYYVEASTLFRNKDDGKDYPAEIIIPKAKIQSNFTFEMAASGDPSTFSFVMDAFPAPTKNNPAKEVLCEIQMSMPTAG